MFAFYLVLSRRDQTHARVAQLVLVYQHHTIPAAVSEGEGRAEDTGGRLVGVQSSSARLRHSSLQFIHQSLQGTSFRQQLNL